MRFDLDVVKGRRGYKRLVRAVRDAGDWALRLYRDGVAREYDTKPDDSPVTEADRQVETILRRYMEKTFPHIEFVGEEFGSTAARAKAGAATPGRTRFIFDPIDGTRAFVRGIPTWSVLLGLEVDSEPLMGIAYFPALQVMFDGYRGGGVHCNDSPVRLSKVCRCEDAVVSHGGLQQFVERDCEALLGRLGRRTFTQRGFADFHGHAQVLLGRVDAMIDPGVKRWDTCVPAALIREAGGAFTSFSGEHDHGGPDVVASNGLIHDELLGLIQSKDVLQR